MHTIALIILLAAALCSFIGFMIAGGLTMHCYDVHRNDEQIQDPDDESRYFNQDEL